MIKIKSFYKINNFSELLDTVIDNNNNDKTSICKFHCEGCSCFIENDLISRNSCSVIPFTKNKRPLKKDNKIYIYQDSTENLLYLGKSFQNNIEINPAICELNLEPNLFARFVGTKKMISSLIELCYSGISFSNSKDKAENFFAIPEELISNFIHKKTPETVILINDCLKGLDCLGNFDFHPKVKNFVGKSFSKDNYVLVWTWKDNSNKTIIEYVGGKRFFFEDSWESLQREAEEECAIKIDMSCKADYSNNWPEFRSNFPSINNNILISSIGKCPLGLEATFKRIQFRRNVGSALATFELTGDVYFSDIIK